MGLGPLVEGYALILTRTHVSCISALEAEHLNEFLRVLALIQRAQRKVYRHSLFFEHVRTGSCVPEGHGEDLCYHAHLHLIPPGIDLARLVSADFKLTLYRDWAEVIRGYQQDQLPYILIQSADRIGIARTPDGVPKRYLRTKVAATIGGPALADWAAFPSYPVVREGWKRLRSGLDVPEPR